MGQFARATALLALVVVTGLLFAGTAGATGSHANHISKVADACATPSLEDIADSDFFWYWPCASFLHVETNPAGPSLGYVRSTPYAIDCPHACTRPFAAGTSVVLTAYPSNGASFTSWSGDACAGQGNPCTAIVNGDTQVTANFGGTVIPKVTHSPMVTLTIFFGLVSSMLPVDTYTFTNPPGGAGGLCDASGGTCSYSYSPGTIVSVTVSDDDNDEDRFRVNGVFGFGTWDSGTSSTTYTFDINSSTVIAPYEVP